MRAVATPIAAGGVLDRTLNKIPLMLGEVHRAWLDILGLRRVAWLIAAATLAGVERAAEVDVDCVGVGSVVLVGGG